MTKTLYLKPILGILVCLIGCSKSRTGTNPEPHIMGRVIEFGTEVPIPNPLFNYSKCLQPYYLGCDKFDAGAISGTSAGVIDVPTKYFSYSQNFSGTGYWSNTTSDQQFSGLPQGSDQPNIVFYPNGTLADSFKVMLFPMVIISVHAKNTSSPLPGTFLECAALFSSDKFRFGNRIILRQGIDTTFRYPVFGNVQDHVYLARYNNGITDTLFSRTQFIANGDVISFSITY